MARTAAAAAALLIFASPAWSFLEDIAIQTQTQYQLFEVKPKDGPTLSNGGLSLTYNIGLRRPLTPLAKLNASLTMNSTENNDSLGRQQNRTMNFNLSTSERTYNLLGGVDDITYTSVTRGSTGEPGITTSGNRNYYVNFNWHEPAWPTTNIQFRRNTTNVSGLSSYATTQKIYGAFYEFKPLRITFDQTSQDFTFTSSQLTTRSSNLHRRTGLEFEQQLLPGLLFEANFGRDFTRTGLVGGRSNNLRGNTQNYRITATPTPSLLFSAERAILDSNQNNGLIDLDTKSTTTTYSMRSEVLPGLSLTTNHQIGDQSGEILNSINKSTSANATARITSDAILALGWNKSDYTSRTGFLDKSKQNSVYASLQTPIGLANDLSLDMGSTRATSGTLDGFKGRYAGLMLRNRTRSDMALGIGYRWSVTDTLGTLQSSQRTNSVDFDMSWFPSSSMGINARMTYSSNNGSNVAEYITPTVDVRWDISSGSTLTLRYNFNRARQWDFTQAQILEQDIRGLSGRLSYRVSNDSNLDITYDFLGSTGGSIEWQRALRVYFTKRL